MGLQPPKSQKNGNFWYKFAPKKKIRWSIEKLEYRRTTKNLPLCNGTITVLKITLFHSVSVITNFVIPKRDITNKNLAIANRSRVSCAQYVEGIYRHKYYTVTLKSRLLETEPLDRSYTT